MVPINEFKVAIEEVFPNADLEVLNPQGDGEHYEVILKSPDFAGLSKLQMHRLFYERLDEILKDIHAIGLKLSAK